MGLSLDSLIEQLDYSIGQLNRCTNKLNIIFGHHRLHSLCYMYVVDQNVFDINTVKSFKDSPKSKTQ